MQQPPEQRVRTDPKRMSNLIPSQRSDRIVVDRIVAVINNDVLTQRELNQRLDLIKHRLQQQNLAVPPSNLLQQQVLEQIVLERIQLQKAKEMGITVDANAVKRTLERLAQANHLSIDQYRARLETEGVPWAMFKRDVKRELWLTRLRQQEVDSQIVVSDAEVTDYLARHTSLTAGSNNSVVQREAARQAVGMKKAEQAYIDWLRALRDRATVQYQLSPEPS